jgi:hypothetical protein
MKLAALLFSVLILRAEPPACETVERGGFTFRSCQRSQLTSCMEFVKAHLEELGKDWMGCAMPAFNYVGYPHPPIPAYTVLVSVTASYRDSETMDISVVYPRPFCGREVWKWKDMQIVAEQEGKLHNAHVEIDCLEVRNPVESERDSGVKPNTIPG